MGKLAGIRADTSLGGIVNDVMSSLSTQILQGLQPEFHAAIKAILERADSELTSDMMRAVTGLKLQINALSKQVSTTPEYAHAIMKMQRDFLGALGRVRIPDNTEQLDRIEAQQPDLYPVIKAINEIEFPVPDVVPRVWDFEIIRDKKGMIDHVIAKAGD